MKKQIPNLVTLMNLAVGCIGVSMAAQGKLYMAALCILLAGIFDLLDGMLARLLKVSSILGKDLDSLADMVSFGVLPAFILHQLFINADILRWLPLIVIPVLAAIRLARFNNDEGQAYVFKGLPTPAAALLLGTWPLALHYGTGFPVSIIDWLTLHPQTGSIVTGLLSLLMVSPITILSMKFDPGKGMSLDTPNRARILIALLAVFMFVFFGLAAFVPLIISYILISVWVYRPGFQSP